jgi:hypothetical protein
MANESRWVLFESRDDGAAAEMLRSQLEREGVATRVEIHGVPGLSSLRILVPRDLLHRANWITRQLPPSDAELAPSFSSSSVSQSGIPSTTALGVVRCRHGGRQLRKGTQVLRLLLDMTSNYALVRSVTVSR